MLEFIRRSVGSDIQKINVYDSSVFEIYLKIYSMFYFEYDFKSITGFD